MKRVLFLGNSYTFFNELWNLFAALAESAGHEVQVDAVYEGGYYLSQLADENDPHGKEAAKKLTRGDWDIVFLQEQSTCAILDFQRFRSGAGALVQKARPARCILYQTWGRKPGSPDLAKHGWSSASMTEELAQAYRKVGTELGADISPVGTAFARVLAAHPEIELYDPDMTHPSLAGSYLAALCHFAAAYGESPLGISFTAGLDAHTAAILQQAAHDILLK